MSRRRASRISQRPASPPSRPSTTWTTKLGVAIAGLGHAIGTQSSFRVHLPMAIGVLVLAGWLRLEPWRWAILLLVVSLVLAAELLNTSIELLVKRLHPAEDPMIGRALDTAAAAVLVAALGSIAVGAITLGPPLWTAISR